jgi:uncharacterized membrane protein YeaQ/YmgE (transglycosylase-associated protein family)
MTFLGFVVLLIVAAFCGSLGAAITGYSTKGCLTSIILGLIGALIGSWLSQQIGIRDIFYFQRIPIIWSIIGAALFVAIVHLIIGDKRRKSRR